MNFISFVSPRRSFTSPQWRSWAYFTLVMLSVSLRRVWRSTWYARTTRTWLETQLVNRMMRLAPKRTMTSGGLTIPNGRFSSQVRLKYPELTTVILDPDEPTHHLCNDPNCPEQGKEIARRYAPTTPLSPAEQRLMKALEVEFRGGK